MLIVCHTLLVVLQRATFVHHRWEVRHAASERPAVRTTATPDQNHAECDEWLTQTCLTHSIQCPRPVMRRLLSWLVGNHGVRHVTMTFGSPVMNFKCRTHEGSVLIALLPCGTLTTTASGHPSMMHQRRPSHEPMSAHPTTFSRREEERQRLTSR